MFWIINLSSDWCFPQNLSLGKTCVLIVKEQERWSLFLSLPRNSYLRSSLKCSYLKFIISLHDPNLSAIHACKNYGTAWNSYSSAIVCLRKNLTSADLSVRAFSISEQLVLCSPWAWIHFGKCLIRWVSWIHHSGPRSIFGRAGKPSGLCTTLKEHWKSRSGWGFRDDGQHVKVLMLFWLSQAMAYVQCQAED